MNHKSSRSGLFLMELIISILFFSIAGAVCVRLFVSSHIISRSSVELNHALEWSQNVAEIFYGCNGEPNQMIERISRIYYIDADFPLDYYYQTDAKDWYPCEFRLIFRDDYEPRGTGEADSLDISTASGYSVAVSLSESEGLVFCNILTQKLPLNTTTADETKTVYELEVTLFPNKEVSDE